MVDNITFSTTKDRIDKIDKFVISNDTPHRSAFINKAIDEYFKQIETRKLLDFMYFIGLPFFAFLISVGVTLVINSLFFYIISAIFGFYLMIFIFLYHNKYKEVKK